MTEQELKKIINNKAEEKNFWLQEKQDLEKTKEVQLYLAIVSYLKKEQTFQEYINDLEIGMDGTIFAPNNSHKDKAFKNTHFGLGQTLNFAFDLLKRETGEKDFYQIPFDMFLSYVENVREVLTTMEHISGDKTVPNPFNLEIYENPKNYSIIDLTTILPISNEVLHTSYNTTGIYADETSFISYNPSCVKEQTFQNLTPREKEAFYGKMAKKALDLLPHRTKSKSIAFNH